MQPAWPIWCTRREISPLELVDAAIARAEATRPEINAIAEPLYDAARTRAKTVDRKLPLAGVPFAIKDLGIAMKGVPTHTGSRIPAFTADFNSVLTERYLAAGLIPIATSTSPEHGLRLMTEFGGLRHHAQSVEHGPHQRRLVGRRGGAGRGRRGAGRACLGWRRLDPRAGGLHRAGRPETVARPRAADAAGQRELVRHGRRPCRHPLGARLRRCCSTSTHGADRAGALCRAGAEGHVSPPRPRATRASSSSPSTENRRSACEISAETQAALDAAVALAREGGHTVEEIDLPYIDRDFMADFAKIVAAAVAGTMRAEASRVGRPCSRRSRARDAGHRALRRSRCSAGEIYAGLQRLDAHSRRLITDTAQYDAVLMPMIAHPPLACGAMDPKGADRAHRERARPAAADAPAEARAAVRPADGQEPVVHPLAGDPECHRPAVDRAAGPCHRAGLPLGIQAAGRPGDEETLLSLAAQMEKISGWLARAARR